MSGSDCADDNTDEIGTSYCIQILIRTLADYEMKGK